MSQNKKSGIYFLIAAISFVVPFFVAWKAVETRPAPRPVPAPDVSGVDQGIWDYLLKTYVKDGLVNYNLLKKDYLFSVYLRQIGTCNPDALQTDDQKLALYCNAYNALVINGVIKNKITDSVNDFSISAEVAARTAEEFKREAEEKEAKKQRELAGLPEPKVEKEEEEEKTEFFDIRDHIFAGKTVSLNHIEHTLIRPVFNDPRVHVALVCAARSCPAIRGEAYTGDAIQTQLQEQSALFANSSQHVQYDAASNKLMLSAILSWYGGDWTAKYPGQYVTWTNKNLDPPKDEQREAGYVQWIDSLTQDPNLKPHLADALSGKIKVGFKKYDWKLNSQAEPKKRDPNKAKGGGFGSGSVPE